MPANYVVIRDAPVTLSSPNGDIDRDFDFDADGARDSQVEGGARPGDRRAALDLLQLPDGTDSWPDAAPRPWPRLPVDLAVRP